MNREKRLQRLKDQIIDAFRDVPYPGDDNIAVNKRDEYCESLSDFKGKHWKDIGFDFLLPYHKSSMGFMTPQAFRFFLPAYLMVTAEFYFESDTLADSTIESLVLPLGESEPWIRTEFFERFDPLSDNQKAAIRLFLEFIRDEYPNQWMGRHLLALERYWKDK